MRCVYYRLVIAKVTYRKYKKNALQKIRNRMTAHLIKRTSNRSDAVRSDL